jgi:putative flavoprotein involved in K+ transport
MSEHLSKLGVPHLVLERNRIAERWRTGRWDSLVANGPAWHDRFPGLEFDDVAPMASPQRARGRLLRSLRTQIQRADPHRRRCVEGGAQCRPPGFTVETSEGVIEANRVVAATGPFQKPVIPPIAPKDSALHQIHSADYRNPRNCRRRRAGGRRRLVGVQIADELQRAGRQVYLSVGAHDRPPRAYRNRDFCWWLGAGRVGSGGDEARSRARDHRRQRRPWRQDHRLPRAGPSRHDPGRPDPVVRWRRGHFQPNLVENLARGDENYLACWMRRRLHRAQRPGPAARTRSPRVFPTPSA